MSTVPAITRTKEPLRRRGTSPARESQVDEYKEALSSMVDWAEDRANSRNEFGEHERSVDDERNTALEPANPMYMDDEMEHIRMSMKAALDENVMLKESLQHRPSGDDFRKMKKLLLDERKRHKRESKILQSNLKAQIQENETEAKKTKAAQGKIVELKQSLITQESAHRKKLEEMRKFYEDQQLRLGQSLVLRSGRRSATQSPGTLLQTPPNEMTISIFTPRERVESEHAAPVANLYGFLDLVQGLSQRLGVDTQEADSIVECFRNEIEDVVANWASSGEVPVPDFMALLQRILEEWAFEKGMRTQLETRLNALRIENANILADMEMKLKALIVDMFERTSGTAVLLLPIKACGYMMWLPVRASKTALRSSIGATRNVLRGTKNGAILIWDYLCEQ